MTSGNTMRRRRRLVVRLLGTAVVLAGLMLVLLRDPVTWMVRIAAQGDALVSALSTPPGLGAPVNLLLVGSDDRDAARGLEGSFGVLTGERADVLAVVRMDRGEVRILRLPRDLRVESETYGTMALATVLEHGGAAGLVASVRELLDIPIHHYVEVDFGGFAAIVDAAGGMPIDIRHATRDNKVGFDFAAGAQVLSGAQAVAYLRSRTPEILMDDEWAPQPGTDLLRIVRQREPLEEMLLQALADDRSAREWIAIARRSVMTDRTFTAWTSALLAWRLRGIDRDRIQSFVLPVSVVRSHGASRSPFEPVHLGGLHWLTMKPDEASVVLAGFGR